MGKKKIKKEYIGAIIALLLILAGYIMYHHGYFGFSIASNLCLFDENQAQHKVTYSSHISRSTSSVWGNTPPSDPSLFLIVNNVPAYINVQSAKANAKITSVISGANNMWIGTVKETNAQVANCGAGKYVFTLAQEPQHVAEPRVEGHYQVTYEIDFLSSCVPNWQCTSWAACDGEVQRRFCDNGCGGIKDESRPCSEGGDNGNGHVCAQYITPNCQFYEQTVSGGYDENNCPLPQKCEPDPNILGPIIFVIFIIAAIGIWYWRRK